MVASAIVLIIVVLCIILCFLPLRYSEKIAISKSLFLLVGCLVGIILAALVVTLLLYFYNKIKNAASRRQGCKFFTPISDNHSPMVENSLNAMEIEACAMSIEPPRAGTMGHKPSENIYNEINMETNYYTKMDIHQHSKKIRHNGHLKIFPGTTLNTIKKKPTRENFAANNQLDILTFEDNGGTRSLLESSC